MNRIGNDEFHINYWEIGKASNVKIKIYPFNLYWERNYDEDDTRIQFGIGIFSYRIGICLDYIN